MLKVIGIILSVVNANANEPHFDTASAVPNQSLMRQVEAICNEIENGAKIVVEAHTDKRGSEEYNLKLSKNRAESVKQLILERCDKKIEEIKAIGMGEYFLVSERHDENRRAVIHLIQEKVKTIVIRESGNLVQEKEGAKESRAEKPEWHVTGFLSNGNYDLSVTKSGNSASAELNRSWSGGVLVEKRVWESMYLGGGATVDGQVMIGVGFGF